MLALVLLLIVFYCQLIFLTPFFTKNLCAISGAIIYNNPFNNDTPPKFRFNERIESYVLDIVFFSIICWSKDCESTISQG